MSRSTSARDSADRDALDPRVQRTQSALRSAFNRLFLEHGYDPITPAQIAAEAGVGRSTFYDHYAGKAGLLRHSVTIILGPLTDAAVGRESSSLVWVMHHIWQNPSFARRMIAGRPAVVVRNRLTELIEEALRLDMIVGLLPAPLLATGVAASQLAVIEAWLTGRHACAAEQVAYALVEEGRRFNAKRVAG